jgi:hypothetical protein
MRHFRFGSYYRKSASTQFGVRSTPEGGHQVAYLAERFRHTLHRGVLPMVNRR